MIRRVNMTNTRPIVVPGTMHGHSLITQSDEPQKQDLKYTVLQSGHRFSAQEWISVVWKAGVRVGACLSPRMVLGLSIGAADLGSHHQSGEHQEYIKRLHCTGLWLSAALLPDVARKLKYWR